MIKLFWTYAILQILQFLQANAVSTRRLSTIDYLISSSSEEKLPNEVSPNSYVLDICPFPEDAYFKGRVTISLTWQEETNKITLHADPDLVIYQSELVVIEGESPTRTIKIARSEKDPEHSWYILHLRRPLSAGTQAQLSMSFTGKLDTEERRGLFLSSYEDSNIGETKYFVGSSLKPNFARKMFPCFDEPEYKTPFKVSIVRRSDMTALSNMPLEQSETLPFDPTWTRDHFQESFPMATYSLGILVSDLISLSVEEDSDIERNFDATIQIWGTPDNLDAVQNISKTIFRAVHNVGDILGLPYPLPKLDCVFVPGLDSNNLGIVFQSYPRVQQILYNVVEQWIGNVLTPGEPNDEVINDSLVIFLVAHIASKDPDYQELVPDYILQVLYRMTDEYSKKLSSDSPKELDTIKIAMVLRMLNYSLGEATLKQALHRFISETKYRTYTENDLWNVITEEAHTEGKLKDLSVNEIVESWSSENRLPVLTVKRNYRDNSATFSQHTYRKYKPNNQDDNTDHKWIIPIVLIKEDNLDFTDMSPSSWLKEESVRLTKMGNRNNFIIANPEEIGPFPVNYDERNWKLISEFLQKEENREKIPFVTRTKLLHDALSLAFADELSYSTALDMVLFLKNEDSDVVWQQFFEAANLIGKYLSESPTLYEKYLRFLQQFLFSLYERLDASEESLKQLTKGLLCEIGYKQCLEEAKYNFDKWIESSDDTTCEIDILTHACNVFRWGTDEDFEIGLQQLIDSETNRSSGHFLYNLVGCADRSYEVERILNISIFERVEDFADDDVAKILLKLSEKAVGYNTVFLYMGENWDVIKERFEDKEELWKTFIESATSHFKTQDGLDLVKNFYSERRDELGSAESTIENSISMIEEEVQRTSVNYQVIEEWLDIYLKNNEDNTKDNFFMYER